MNTMTVKVGGFKHFSELKMALQKVPGTESILDVVDWDRFPLYKRASQVELVSVSPKSIMYSTGYPGEMFSRRSLLKKSFALGLKRKCHPEVAVMLFLKLVEHNYVDAHEYAFTSMEMQPVMDRTGHPVVFGFDHDSKGWHIWAYDAPDRYRDGYMPAWKGLIFKKSRRSMS